MTELAVGWIGVGAMGGPMVRHLLRAGHSVRVFDLDPARAQAALNAGATWEDSPTALARQTDLIFSTVFGDDGLVGVAQAIAQTDARRCRLHADLSTVTPQASARAAGLLDAVGVDYLRIPVSGTATLAETADVRTYASGPKAAYDEVLPLLRCFSSYQEWVGAGETARVIKLAINTVLYLSTAALGEALTMADEAGVDRAVILKAIDSSVVGNAHFKGKADKIVHRDWRPVGPLTLAAKDLDMALAAAGVRANGMHLAHAVRASVAGVPATSQAGNDVACLADHTALTRLAAGEPDRGLLAADDARYAAMVEGDLEALGRFLAEELLYTHSSGITDDKSQYLASLASGRVRYHHTHREDERIAVNGPWAAMSGLSIIDATVDGVAKHLRNRFTATWISKAGQWRLSTWASTPLPQA